MWKTTKVAADRAYDQTKTVLPAEVAQGVYMENAPSLRALKLMHLMIGKAGGRMADDVLHDMRLSDIRKIEGMAHHDQQSLKPLFIELRAATIIHDQPERSRWTIGGLLDEATVDYRHELTGDVLISWSFGRTFRRMAQESNHWAILDRQAVFHLGSKYSVLLFQHIASLQNLKHVTSKRFTVPELRAVLGIPEGKVKRFADLKRDVIAVAIAEINSDLTRLHLTATYHKVGRMVAEVEIAWEIKKDLTKVTAELDRPRAGRKARRDGTAETPALAFPASGTIRDAQPWGRIARDTAPRLEGGHVPDLRKLADAFRAWCAERAIPLDAASIEKTFTTWCKRYSAR
ncbi:MAG: replication initiation protein [Alteromonadaceae bacterium]|nr:replication initiation protein [Alteromonadaceae bacterium]